MLSKGDNNIWFRKKQPVPNEKWPELEKPKQAHRESFNETFPEFGKWKNKDVIDNPENILRYQANVHRKNEDVQDSTTRSFTEKSFLSCIYQDPKKQLKTNDSLDSTNVPVIREREDNTRSRKEERKLSHKILIKTKKEASRQEKRRQREEDILRKMVGPKGLGVSLIDAETFSKFAKAEVNCPTSTKSFQEDSSTMNDMNIDSLAFPELSLISKKSHVKSFCTSRNRNYLIPIEKSVKGDQISQYECCNNGREHVEGLHMSGSKRPRKKKDPVIVDIMKAIEICKFDKKTNKIGGTDDVLIAKKKKNSNPQIIGNLLDSSNPMRHRGKKREGHKKRLTRLKKAVMAERERRNSQKEINASDSKANLCDHSYQPETKDKTVMSNADCVTTYKPGVSHNITYTRSECVQKPKDVSEVGKTSNIEILDCAAAMTEADVDVMVREELHSKKFREYCNHCNSTELSEAVKLMLQDIIRFQDRSHLNQPIKAESHRRYVVGLRQTQNLLSVHKIKVIVMASDIEKVPSPGGLDDLVHSIIDGAGKQCVPVVFPLQRRQLGKVMYRKVGISCVGILNYQGSESNFQRLVVTLEDAKKDYLEKFEKEKSRIMNNLGLCHIKKEENSSDVTVPLKVEAVVTLPLFLKLTEAISDISLQSTCQKNVNDEHILIK